MRHSDQFPARVAVLNLRAAPKDGTAILVWPTWWDDSLAIVRWKETNRGGHRDGKWVQTWSKTEEVSRATHWHPLPASPNIERHPQ